MIVDDDLQSRYTIEVSALTYIGKRVVTTACHWPTVSLARESRWYGGIGVCSMDGNIKIMLRITVRITYKNK